MNIVVDRNINHVFSPPAEPDNCELVKRIALRTLGELGIALGIGLLMAPFIAPAGIAVLATAIAFQTIMSLVIRTILTFYEAHHKPSSIVDGAKWLSPSLFATATSDVHTLIHESGHAMAANLLLVKPTPKIEVFPFVGGVTSYRVIGPSSLGKKIGIDNIQPIVAAAGPAVSLAASSAMLYGGLSLLNSSPEEGRILIVSAMIDFLSHLIYAISTFFASPANFSHDFVCLWAAGIHPAVSITAIVALPILIIGGYHFFKRH